MSRFINTELKSDSDSDSDSQLDSEKAGAKFDTELDILLIGFIDLKQVLFMPIFLREYFFSQALLGLKIRKHFNQFN